jgi:hypothetical protein
MRAAKKGIFLTGLPVALISYPRTEHSSVYHNGEQKSKIT